MIYLSVALGLRQLQTVKTLLYYQDSYRLSRQSLPGTTIADSCRLSRQLQTVADNCRLVFSGQYRSKKEYEYLKEYVVPSKIYTKTHKNL